MEKIPDEVQKTLDDGTAHFVAPYPSLGDEELRYEKSDTRFDRDAFGANLRKELIYAW